MVNYRDEKMLRVNHSFKAVRSVGHRSRRSQGARLAYTGFPRNKAPSQLSRREWLSDSTAVSERETGNLGPCVSVTSALILIVHVSIQQLGSSTLCRMIHCLLCSVCIHECQDPVQTTPHRTHTRALFLAAHARTPDVITRLAQGLTMCVPQKSFHHWSCLC